MDSEDYSYNDYDEEQQADSYGYEMDHLKVVRSQNSEYLDAPILQYSYSGMSNVSSNHQLHLLSSKTSEQQSDHLTFLRSEELFTTIKKLVQEVHETLYLEEDILLYILYFYKWSKDRLYERYFEKLSKSFAPKNQIIKQILLCDINNGQGRNKEVCLVCEEETFLLRNPLCEHEYCSNCWNGYIDENLKKGIIFFGCMNGCQQCPVLLNSFIKPHFPAYLDMFMKMICINFTKFNKNISYCPGGSQSCDYFCQELDGVHVNLVECLCSNFYCFSCQREPHFPASCQDVNKWEQILNSQEGSIKWIEQNTEKCPCCHALVNKYIGCSYIKCVCGTEFCYNCLSRWDEIHQMNRGECLKMKKKSSLQERAVSATFLDLQEKIMSINRTMNRSHQIISETLGLIQEEWIKGKFHGIKREVSEAWYALKWGLIAQFIYKRASVEQFIEDQFINSIVNLVDLMENAEKSGLSMGMKEVINLGDEVMQSRESMKKNMNFWIDAWRNC